MIHIKGCSYEIKTCACTGAAVNYTPEGMWNAYEKGQPVIIMLYNHLDSLRT